MDTKRLMDSNSKHEARIAKLNKIITKYADDEITVTDRLHSQLFRCRYKVVVLGWNKAIVAVLKAVGFPKTPAQKALAQFDITPYLNAA